MLAVGGILDAATDECMNSGFLALDHVNILTIWEKRG